MVNHPNRSKQIKPGKHDLGNGWEAEYFPKAHSGAPEILSIYPRTEANGPLRVNLTAESIAKLRRIFRAA